MGLVQQNGHAFGLLLARGGVDLDLRIGADALAQHRHFAVHLDPARFDPSVRLAA